MTAPDSGYIIIGFRDAGHVRAGFARLSALAADGEITLVGVEFVHSIHGVASTVSAGSVDRGLAGFDRHAGVVLSQADLDVVADAIPPGTMAAVVVYRNGVILPALAQWSADGATVVGEGVFSASTGLAAPG